MATPSLPSPPVAPITARRVVPWLLLAAAIVVFRTLLFVLHGTIAFDADQAVVGLMAKHIAEGRAFPVYQYALPYVLMLTSWIAAGFFLVLGPTVAALKLPLLLMNVGVGVALVWAIVRVGVRPGVATLLALPVLLAPPVTSSALMDALGMTIEPLAFVLALWFTRRAPLVFGMLAGIGFHVREFVAYGVAAVICVDVVTGRGVTRDGLRHWALVALGCLGSKAVIDALARFASPSGPDTWLVADTGDNLSTLSGAFCFAPRQAWRNVVALGASYLGLLWGAQSVDIAAGAVQTQARQGLAGLWPLFGGVLTLLGARLLWHWQTMWALRGTAAGQLALFLLLVGAQAVGVYAVSRCGPLSLLTLRYALAGVFLPTGLGLLVLLVEPSRLLRGALLTALLMVAAVNARAHVALWREQWASPLVPNRVRLAQALEQQGIRYARSDYWTAYYVTFLTQERVVVGAETFSRIAAYERALEQHADHVVHVSTRRCGAAPPVVPGYYVCHETPR